MTNGERYKTAQERAEAFEKFCKRDYDDYNCESCKFHPCKTRIECGFAWLDLEAEEEKPLLCPYCGLVPVSFIDDKTGNAWVACTCGYQSPEYKSESLAIAAHNRVAKKCREGKE